MRNKNTIFISIFKKIFQHTFIVVQQKIKNFGNHILRNKILIFLNEKI